MARTIPLTITITLLFSCARASRTSLECVIPDPPSGEPYGASCAADGLLVCRDASGSRCLPARVSCYESGDFVCEEVLGVPSGELEAICLVGDFDREGVLRTTPRCSEPRRDGGS